MVDKTFGQREPNVQYNDRRGAYLIAVKDGKAAVVKTPTGYFLIGGGIENGEDPVQCLEREAMEETGCRVAIQEYIGSAEAFREYEGIGYFHPVQFYYGGMLVEKIASPIETDHILEWISVEDIESKMRLEMQAWAIRRFVTRQKV